MDDLTRLPATNPTDLFRARDGLYAPEMLGAAVIGLDLFSWLAKSPAGAPTICASLGLAERPTDVMLTLFCAMGLLENRAGIFQLTEKSREFLVRDSPWFLGPYYASFGERPVAQSLLEVLRTGKPSVWASNKKRKPWAQAMEDDAFAREFTGIMDARGLYLGPAMARQIDLSSHHRLLDIGGGSGIYACCLVAAYPHLQASVFEKPPVDRVSRQCIARRGYSERVNVIAGDMFTGPLPEGCDVHLWSNALHDWDAATVKSLLGKSFAALSAGGRVLVHDAHVNREKSGPLSVAAYSVFLMASTEGKCYSIGEMESILGEVGFADFEFRETAVDHSVITARKPHA
ncbi:MAG: methyltransferase [Candidatus Acidiferrales bacterium]